MKYYLDNIKNLMFKISESNMFIDEMICSGPFHLYYSSKEQKYNLAYTGKCEELYDWLSSKELFFDITDLPDSTYGCNITIYGVHVILSEKDKEFLFYLKLSKPYLFEE